MCEKCVRRGKKSKMKLGRIKFFAHQVTDFKFNSIPLFSNSADNFAIEGFIHKIRKQRTNKKFYSRKRKDLQEEN